MAVTATTTGPRKPSQTRERLLDAGRKLFADRGLHGVTTHDIAGHAGYAAGTFYLHFRDKTELFRVIAEDTLDLLRECLNAATRDRRGTPDAVRPFTEALVGFAEENRDMMRILFSRSTETVAVEANLLNELAGSIAENRRTRAASGKLETDINPEVLAHALVGMLARVIAWWVEDPARAKREAVIETLIRIQLNGTHPATRA